MSDTSKESLIQDQILEVSLEGTKKILFQMENCICKIYSNNGSTGTGFFCRIKIQYILFPLLITSYNVLNENDIENNKIIDLIINNKALKITLDKRRLKYTNKELGVTFIEIKIKKDEIYENNFMEIEENDLDKEKNMEYKRKSIYILHYPKGKLNVSYGIINDLLNEKTINHYCKIEEGSSSSPILSIETFKIIGMHNFSSNKYTKLNFGTFIKCIINDFINNVNKHEIFTNLKYNSGKNREETISEDIGKHLSDFEIMQVLGEGYFGFVAKVK